ncbi:hypothetical protein EXIGLDRAFT_53260 [Exidia glandulosa HHB12029]|uniref:Uncharacterized protein n=1 Tax=Exidia glandulosa HHB12029 TaxID=1314781 RepID=A0A165IB75_EXIGL|nr:hypothetical protein EXIGLDRAFT_53260 [Exidia glandulosa HHB12029]
MFVVIPFHFIWLTLSCGKSRPPFPLPSFSFLFMPHNDDSPLRLSSIADNALPVALLTLTVLVVAAGAGRSWAGQLTGKRRKLSHPAPAAHVPAVSEPVQVPAPESVSDGGGSTRGSSNKRTKERRKRDNKARAARRDELLATQYLQTLATTTTTDGDREGDDLGSEQHADVSSDPPAATSIRDRELAPAPPTPPSAPTLRPTLSIDAALNAPLPPDSDDDSLFEGDNVSVAESQSTNPTSIGLPTPLSLSASDTLQPPPLSLSQPIPDGWYRPRTPPPERARSPHADFGSLDPHPPPRAGVEAQLACVRKELAKALMEADRAAKGRESVAQRCDELERELEECRRRENEVSAQTQIQQLVNQLHVFHHAQIHAQQQQRAMSVPMSMPMPIPIPMQAGMPMPMPMPVYAMHAHAHMQQRGSPVPFSPVLHAQQPPAYNGQQQQQFLSPVMYAAPYPPQQQQQHVQRATSPSVAEAILRRPEILGAEEGVC